ncbi:MAG: hypothetical protein KAI66_06890 [Lentisphaeria bacterium]|nr:hypothetical protein [Lentisphaeria bacterium]
MTARQRIHRHTLVEMNRSVCTARRDVACERIAELLPLVAQEKSANLRCEGYKRCAVLADEAMRATRRSQLVRENPLTRCLQLLQETLQAQVSTTGHQAELGEETEELAQALARDDTPALETVQEIFLRDEKNLAQSLDGLLRLGAPLLEADTRERKKSFSEDDHRRHQTATEEFRNVYGNGGGITPPQKMRRSLV